MYTLVIVLLILDAVLLLAFVALIARTRQVLGTVRSLDEVERLMAPVEQFIEAARITTHDLERNLNTRREIMNELLASLDDRAEQLEELIQAADRTLGNETGGRRPYRSRLLGKDLVEAKEPEETPPPRTPPSPSLPGVPPARAAGRGGGGGGQELAAPLPASHSRVLDLAEQGFDAAEIASSLSLPRGEVQLILDLNRKYSS